jgi:hypothetical protein
MNQRRTVERCLACEADSGRHRGLYVPTITERGRDNKTHRGAHPFLSGLDAETHIKRVVATPRPRKRGNAPRGDPIRVNPCSSAVVVLTFAPLREIFLRVHSRFLLAFIRGPSPLHETPSRESR